MPAQSTGARAEKTRSAVLEAAETIFAERGFAATRLEDIAERVGIRRASIVYYFRDKRELYEAVLASVFGDLLTAVAPVLSRDAPLAERIEQGVSTWVDYVGGRPSIARLILREAANARPEQGSGLLEQAGPFAELVRREIFDRPDYHETKFAPVDPVHVASTVVGATVFLVAAMPAMIPDMGFSPVSREHLEAHKRELLEIVRRLLGTRGPRRT